MPLSIWKEVAFWTWREAGNDSIGLITAGVAFYGFLALVPLLGGVSIVNGLVFLTIAPAIAGMEVVLKTGW
jgi:membrane protein